MASVRVSPRVTSLLHAAPLSSWGFVIAHLSDDASILTLINLAKPATPNTSQELTAITVSLPSPLFVAGIFTTSSTTLPSRSFLLPLLHPLLPPCLPPLHLARSSPDAPTPTPLTIASLTPSPTQQRLPFTVLSAAEDAAFWASVVAVRLSASAAFPVPEAVTYVSSSPVFPSFKSRLSSEAANAFFLPAVDMLVPSLASPTAQRALSELDPALDLSRRRDGAKKDKAKDKKPPPASPSIVPWEERTLTVELLSSSSASRAAPSLTVYPSSTTLASLSLSALHLTAPTASLSSVLPALLSALRAQAERTPLLSSTAYHFATLLPHPVTVTYPTADSLEDALPLRELYHQRFFLPTTQPLLRPSCALSFAPPPPQTRLLSPHLHVSSLSSATGGVVALTRVPYLYCHYLQDGFRDDGWGCAYRSLQSICSSLLLLHLTDRPIPSIPALQRLLSAHAPHDPAFLDPHHWIGAVDAQAALQLLYGLPSRLLHVRDGADVGSVSRALSRYFAEEDGGFVLVGGGVLAYGVVGVDWNERSGECRYLIVDPHYTGVDELGKALKGGWVGWKSKQLFLPGRFYNFLLPSVPKGV